MKDILHVLAWMVGFLIPPPANADPQRIWAWRVKVAVVTMANSLSNAIIIALALGAVPAVFAGFASQTQVSGVEGKFDAVHEEQQRLLLQLQKNQLDTKIMETRTRQCEAIKQAGGGGDDAKSARKFATDRLEEELDDYQQLFHNHYRLPDCSEV